MGLAKGRFWLATLMQMTFPGVPSIYYGDEYCLEGLSDPGNRRTLPLEKDIYDRDMQDILRNASRSAVPFRAWSTAPSAHGCPKAATMTCSPTRAGAAMAPARRYWSTEASIERTPYASPRSMKLPPT